MTSGGRRPRQRADHHASAGINGSLTQQEPRTQNLINPITEHQMSDLSDLHGVFPTSLRWNAETGILAVSIYNSESGARELQEIALGQPATFVMDLATRERGYGLIKTGLYDMRLTPVRSPAPDLPDDPEFKVAIGCWLWNPIHGELRLEANAALIRDAVANVWDRAQFDPQAAEGLQPVVSFVSRVSILIKAVNKSFFAPVIDIVGWVERDKVPGWANRAPTVPPPVVPPLLTASSAPAPTPATPAAKTPSKVKPKAKRGAAKK
jgi:hypothetical protein